MKTENLSRLIRAYRSLKADVRKQRLFLRDTLMPDVALARQNNDGSLDEEDFTKVLRYYGFGVPAIVGEGFCTLRGIAMNRRERLGISYLGALTGLYDDFFDKTNLPHDRIREMMDRPDNFNPDSSLEKLFILFLGRVHENLPDKAYFSESFNKVFEAQLKSKSQKSQSLRTGDIIDITYEKGGLSLLFYRSVFPERAEAAEEDALYHAGGLMQLGNDIFDVYRDSRAHIQTLPTTCRNIAEIREIYTEKLAKAIAGIRASGFQYRQIQKYLDKFLLGMSRCPVCLDQLESLESRSGNTFKPMEYERTDLICDMEKPANMLHSVRHFLSLDY
jgi:hypothetical protein